MGLHILYVDGCVYNCFGLSEESLIHGKLTVVIVTHCAIHGIMDKRLHACVDRDGNGKRGDKKMT